MNAPLSEWATNQERGAAGDGVVMSAGCPWNSTPSPGDGDGMQSMPSTFGWGLAVVVFAIFVGVRLGVVSVFTVGL